MLAHGEAHAQDGKWKLEGSLQLKAALRWRGSWNFDGRLKDGSLYVGWVDSKTNEPVDDKEVKGRYEKDILLHAGVRLIGKYYKTFL